MAIAEHEITQQEITQSITIRLTESQVAKLKKAAEANNQSVENFVVAALVRATSPPLKNLILPSGRDPLDSIIGIFKDSPELDALMERIHEEQRQEIEQFRLEAEAEEAAEQAKVQKQ